MDDSKFNKYKTVSEIIKKASDEVIKLCHEKNGINYICGYSDNLIKNELSKIYKKSSKGLMIPTCISRNEIVSHCNIYENDLLKDGDILRIEVAVHIDNNVVNYGNTIRVGYETWNEGIINAAKVALKLGVQNIEPNMDILQFKKVINEVAEYYNLNLLKRPDVYNEEDTTIFYDWCFRDSDRFNEPSWVVKYEHELELDENYYEDDEIDKNDNFKIGEAYHLTVAFTESGKKTKISDVKPCLFQNTKIKTNLKVNRSREVISEVNNKLDKVFFKINDLSLDASKAKLGLRECIDKGVIRSLGIVECNMNVVILKCTIIVQKNSVYILGEDYDMEGIELSGNLERIKNLDKKFIRREII